MSEAPQTIKFFVDKELDQALRLCRYKTGQSVGQVVRDALYAYPFLEEYLDAVKKENAAKGDSKKS